MEQDTHNTELSLCEELECAISVDVMREIVLPDSAGTQAQSQSGNRNRKIAIRILEIALDNPYGYERKRIS